jgi:NAD(P)-dependent dehydrogenase (short-subunit alcohol dehydrogenase family)
VGTGQAARCVLVTGASTGLGLQLAERLAARGWRVFAGVRRAEDEARVRALHPAGILPVRLDVTDAGSIAAAARLVEAEVAGRGLDALVNNAGIAVAGPVEGVGAEDWRRQFEVNVIGPVATTQAMLPLLRAARGRVVMVSSVSGLLAYPLLGPYAASKHALEALSDSLRLELAREAIAVVVVEPGEAATAIWEKAAVDAERRRDAWPPAVRDRYAARVDRLLRHARRTAATAPDARDACLAIERALEAARPPARLLAGRGARLGWLLSHLPARWLDRLVLRALDRDG